MNTYKFNDITYKLIENYKEGFNETLVAEKMTDYFDRYDYIVGDWAYGKIRLKGFCNKKNRCYKKINAISLKEKYIKENCAYDCRYFVIKKEEKNKS